MHLKMIKKFEPLINFQKLISAAFIISATKIHDSLGSIFSQNLLFFSFKMLFFALQLPYNLTYTRIWVIQVIYFAHLCWCTCPIFKLRQQVFVTHFSTIDFIRDTLGDIAYFCDSWKSCRDTKILLQSFRQLIGIIPRTLYLKLQ